MIEILEALLGLDWLADRFPTRNGRLAVTVATAGALLVVLVLSRRLQQWLNRRMRPVYADLATAVTVVGAVALSTAIALGVWEQTELIGQFGTGNGLSSDVVARAVVSLLLVVGGYIVARFVSRFLNEVLASASAVTDHQREITHRVMQVGIWGTTLVVVLGIWIEDLGGLLVGAGFLGIVLGMAARQTLGAMLAGFVLMFDRPFEIGDWIRIDDREGVVTDISIFNTRIQTFAGEYVMVPNDVVSSSMVTNRSRRGSLRIEIEVGVDYETDLESASRLAEEAIDGLDEGLSTSGPRVVTKAFGDSAILLGVWFWIDRPSSSRRWKARTAAIAAIKEAFEEEGIEIPYPQRELSGRGAGFPTAQADTESERDPRSMEPPAVGREGE